MRQNWKYRRKVRLQIKQNIFQWHKAAPETHLWVSIFWKLNSRSNFNNLWLVWIFANSGEYSRTFTVFQQVLTLNFILLRKKNMTLYQNDISVLCNSKIVSNLKLNNQNLYKDKVFLVFHTTYDGCCLLRIFDILFFASFLPSSLLLEPGIILVSYFHMFKYLINNALMTTKLDFYSQCVDMSAASCLLSEDQFLCCMCLDVLWHVLSILWRKN